MSELQNKPTAKFYGLFQYIFDYYNEHLFNNEIKDCIIIVERRANTMGHFTFKQWFHLEEKEIDELALNPTYFLKFPLIEICQTIVHEMCHGWQFHYGKPSRRGYHNKEWSIKMQDIGLMPSSTGKEGGKKTGQSMNDYPIKDGLFLEVTEQLLNNEIFTGLFYEVNPNILDMISEDKPLFDQIKNLSLVEGQLGTTKPKTKTKYSCGCSNVWGKPNLSIICGDCGNSFEAL